MLKPCRQCNQQFEITDDDLKFYEKISPVFAGKKYLIPAPTLCPDCRWQRKMAWRNFQKYYYRKSDFSGTSFVSVFSPDKPYKVYKAEEWWSDKWDPLSYGRDFDFSRPFFDQFSELYNAVPRPGTSITQSVNCDYTNATYSSKNCYLTAPCVLNEDCYFSHVLWYSKDCMDMLYSYHCERSYELIDCHNCYKVFNSQECVECSESYYLFDCRNCKNCFGCVGLINKQFYIFNQAYTQEEYLKKLPELLDPKNKENHQKNIEKISLSTPHRAMYAKNVENVTGNHIYNSRNLQTCFDIIDSQDCKFCFTAGKLKDCYDCIHNGGGLEIGYETFASVGYNLLFTRDSFSASSNLIYCSECNNVSDCFGCVGLHAKEQYCIFNKKYTKNEYEILVSKIIKHMQKTGEWGEYFPMQLSPFCYNETIAYEYYPLDKKQTEADGLKWKDVDISSHYQGTKNTIPQNIQNIPDDFIKQILTCSNCRKNYKIISQELNFYRNNNLIIPNECPDCRYQKRMSLRNPRKLWDRGCMCVESAHANHGGNVCRKGIKTTYAPDCPEKIYCEECYLKEVY